ncbi:MAG: NAD-binding protein, partial [Gammaproteobacteria bacterium]
MRIFFAGAGQCAEYVARRLIREGHDLTLMDSDEARCLELAESLDASIVHDDVTRNDAWLHAGLAGAELFVGCTDSDQANILACLIANELAPDALKSIRLRTPEFHEWDRMLNDLKVRVDRVVHPETDILERILRVLAIPGVSDIRTFADNRVKVFSMNISANGLLADRSIREVLDEDAMNEARVCLLFRGTSVRIPGPDEVFHAGDHIYVVTTHAAMNKTLKTMGIVPRPKLREVFIVGGGELALELARTLEERHIPVKLFERNAARCEFLADQLLDATII